MLRLAVQYFPANQSSPKSIPRTAGRRITVWLFSSLIGLDLTKQEKMLLFACTETTGSKPVPQETSCKVITPPAVSLLCPALFNVGNFLFYGQALLHESLSKGASHSLPVSAFSISIDVKKTIFHLDNGC